MTIKKQVDLMYKAHTPEPLSRKQKKERKKGIKSWIENAERLKLWETLDVFYIPSHDQDFARINWVNPKDPR